MSATPLWKQVIKLKADLQESQSGARAAEREAFGCGYARGFNRALWLAGGTLMESIKAGVVYRPADAIVEAAWLEFTANKEKALCPTTPSPSSSDSPSPPSAPGSC